jgi:aspartate/tyrosine/aromatic aminotransferase
MFENFPHKPLFGANLVSKLFAEDTRDDKLDLGLGVYKSSEGQTTILRSVKKAEARLLKGQETKSYVGLAGDKVFSRRLAELTMGSDQAWDRISIAQTPGGVAAMRVGFEMVHAAQPGATVWVSNPTWANHPPIIQHAGLAVQAYPYLNEETGGVDFDAMTKCLGGLPAGDVVLLQASCHNPTGAGLENAQWDIIAELCKKRGLLPFLDVAYQGFGMGIEEDSYAPRLFAKVMPELLVAVTCSKNFANYRDRVGIIAIQATNSDTAHRSSLKMLDLINALYAMPPDHGAAIVSDILSDQGLRSEWERELAEMRERLANLRIALAAAMRRETNSTEFDFLERQQGMFSILPVTPEQVEAMRIDHGMYIVSNGRINIAGIAESQVNRVAKVIAGVRQVSST